MVTGRRELGCGVADYSARLATALGEAGVEVELLTPDGWRLRSTRAVRATVAAVGADVVHLQYPTAGYRTSLGPHLLSLVEPPTVLTLHEASQAHPLRQASLLALLARPGWVVFTTAAERDHVGRRLPWVRRRSSVIPIGSTIPAIGGAGNGDRPREDRIVYFGLLTPEKGLDDVVALAELARERPGTRVLVVGRPEPRSLDLPDRLRAQAADLPLDWALDLDAPDVAELLATSAVGYLPFPDGASERRSSLLALLVNGVATLTTPGPYVDDELAAAVQLVDGPDAAWAAARALLDDPAARAERSAAAVRYGTRRDWGDIARRHVALYERLLDSGPAPAVPTDAAGSAG